MAWVPAAIAGVQLIAGWLGQRKQNKAEKNLAAYQAQMNERYLQQQLEYNSPKNQMSRFSDAGVNPHLIYGQGNPGNQGQPLSYPQQGRTDYQSVLNSIGPLLNQSMMTQSQVSANDAKTNKTYVETALLKTKDKLMKQNPMFNDTYVEAMIDSMIATARSKTADSKVSQATSDWFTGEKSWRDADGKEWHGPAGAIKMEKELQLIVQKYDLGSQDQAIKAQVLKSAQFKNDLLDIQRKWMVDGEITAQHIYQFVQMFIMQLMK